MAGDGMLPSDFFRRNVVLSFQEDSHRHSPARRHRPRQHDVGQRGVGLGLSAQRVDVSQSRKILAGVPDDEQAKPARTTIRGSPPATPPACTILTWRG